MLLHSSCDSYTLLVGRLIFTADGGWQHIFRYLTVDFCRQHISRGGLLLITLQAFQSADVLFDNCWGSLLTHIELPAVIIWAYAGQKTIYHWPSKVFMDWFRRLVCAGSGLPGGWDLLGVFGDQVDECPQLLLGLSQVRKLYTTDLAKCLCNWYGGCSLYSACSWGICLTGGNIKIKLMYLRDKLCSGRVEEWLKVYSFWFWDCSFFDFHNEIWDRIYHWISDLLMKIEFSGVKTAIQIEKIIDK